MADIQGIRKLAAILSADVVGYSRLMGDDDAATVETLTAYRTIFSNSIDSHRGRLVDSPGDNLLAEFASPVDAVQCAAAVQRRLAEENAPLDSHRRMQFRIGINLGDVIERDRALYGDGVNIAARLEALAEPGGICISGKVFDEVKTKVPFGFDYFGKQDVKNIEETVRAYRVVLEGDAEGRVRRRRRRTADSSRRGLVLIGVGAALIAAIAAGAGFWQVNQLATEIATEPTLEDQTLSLPDGPSIAVLPFRNGSGDPDQDYFSDGISEEIIIALSRFPNLFVLGRNTTFQFKGQNIDAKQIGTNLGVRYVLGGTVRRVENTVRVSAELLDAGSGALLWGESYQGDLTASSIFDVQDKITGQVVGTVASSSGILVRTDLEASKGKAPEALSAYDCVLQYYAYNQSINADEHRKIRDCLERAVITDPEYVDAWAWLAALYLDEFRFHFNEEPDALERALTKARRAVDLDPTHQNARWVLASILFHRRELDAFKAEVERAIALNPNNATTLGGAGLYMAYAGDWDRGLALVRKAIALNPNHPSWFHFAFFHDHFRKGEFELALADAQKINAPDFFRVHLVTAAAYAALGRIDEARTSIAEVQRLHPTYTLKDVAAFYHMFNMSEDVSGPIIAALRDAGLPEGDPPVTN